MYQLTQSRFKPFLRIISFAIILSFTFSSVSFAFAGSNLRPRQGPEVIKDEIVGALAPMKARAWDESPEVVLTKEQVGGIEKEIRAVPGLGEIDIDGERVGYIIYDLGEKTKDVPSIRLRVDGRLVVVLNSAYEHFEEITQDAKIIREIAFHEAREDFWQEQDFSPKQAHFIASAEQNIKFSTKPGIAGLKQTVSPTFNLPTYRYLQVTKMSPAQLQSIIEEYKSGSREQHYKVIKEANAKARKLKIKEIDIDKAKSLELAIYNLAQDLLRKEEGTVHVIPPAAPKAEKVVGVLLKERIPPAPEFKLTKEQLAALGIGVKLGKIPSVEKDYSGAYRTARILPIVELANLREQLDALNKQELDLKTNKILVERVPTYRRNEDIGKIGEEREKINARIEQLKIELAAAPATDIAPFHSAVLEAEKVYNDAIGSGLSTKEAATAFSAVLLNRLRKMTHIEYLTDLSSVMKKLNEAELNCLFFVGVSIQFYTNKRGVKDPDKLLSDIQKNIKEDPQVAALADRGESPAAVAEAETPKKENRGKGTGGGVVGKILPAVTAVTGAGIVLLTLGGATALLAAPGYTNGVPVSPPAIYGQLVPGTQPEFALGGGKEEKAPAITIPADAGWKAQGWVDSRAVEQVMFDKNQTVMDVKLYSEANFRKQLGDYLKKNPIAGFDPDSYREINDLVGALSAKVEAMPSAPSKLKEILEMGERTKGEAFIDLRYDDYGIPGWNRGSGVDLSRYKIQVTLEIPDGLPGANNAPNGIQIFLKSDPKEWYGWYGGWTNIDHSGKMTVAVDVKGTVPNWVVPGFEAGNCVGLGVKLGTGGNAHSDYQFQGQVKILEVKLIPSTISNLVSTPAPLPKVILQPVSPDSFRMNSGRNLNWGEETPYGFAVGSEDGYSKIMPNGKTRIYNALAKAKAEGGGARRVWFFMDLRNWNQITELKNGKLVLKAQVFKDIQAAIDAQRETGVKVVPCLYDFHILNGISVERGSPVGEHPEFFTKEGLSAFTETMRPAYEMVASAFDYNDPMNEPENAAPAAGTNLAFNPHIYNFIKAAADEIHKAGGRVTIGASRPQDLAKYRNIIDIGQIHCYGVDIPNAGELGVGDMPVFIGEYGARTPQEVARITKEAHSKGYFGIMFWGNQDGFTSDGLKEGLNTLPKTTTRPQQTKPAVTPQKAPVTSQKAEVTTPKTQEAGVIEIDPAKFTVQGNEFYLDVSYGIPGLPSASGGRSGIDLRGYDLEFTFKGGRGEQAQAFFKNSSWANVYSGQRSIVPGQPFRYDPSNKNSRDVSEFDNFNSIYAIGVKFFGGVEGIEITNVRLIKKGAEKRSESTPPKPVAVPQKAEVTQPKAQESGAIEINPSKFTIQGDEFYLDVSYGISGLASASGGRSGIDLRGYDLEFTFKGGDGQTAQIYLKDKNWANVYAYPKGIIPGQPIRFNPSKDGKNVDDFDDFSRIYAVGAKISGGTDGLQIVKVRLVKSSGAKHSQVIPQNEERMDKFAQAQNYLKSAAENYRALQAEINSNPDLAGDAETQVKLKDLETKINYWAKRCLDAGGRAGLSESDLSDLVNVIKNAAQLGITLPDYIRLMAYWSAKAETAPYLGKQAWVSVKGNTVTVAVEGETIETVALSDETTGIGVVLAQAETPAKTAGKVGPIKTALIAGAIAFGGALNSTQATPPAQVSPATAGVTAGQVAKGTPQVQQPKPAVTPQKAPVTSQKAEVTQPKAQESGAIEINPSKFTIQGDEFYLDVSYGISGLASVSGGRSGIDLRGYDLEFTFKGGDGQTAQIYLKNKSWANVYAYPKGIIPGQPIRFNPSKDGKNVDDFDDFSHIYAVGAKISGGTDGLQIVKVRLVKRSTKEQKAQSPAPEGGATHEKAYYTPGEVEAMGDQGQPAESNGTPERGAGVSIPSPKITTPGGITPSLPRPPSATTPAEVEYSIIQKLMDDMLSRNAYEEIVKLLISSEATTSSPWGYGTHNAAKYALADEVRHNNPAAVKILSDLTEDPNQEIADWASTAKTSLLGGVQQPAPKDMNSKSTPESQLAVAPETVQPLGTGFDALLGELKEGADYYNMLAKILPGLNGQKIELIIDRPVLGSAITEEQVERLIQAIKNGGIDLIVSFDNSINETDRDRVYFTTKDKLPGFRPESVKNDRIVAINPLTDGSQGATFHKAVLLGLGLRGLTRDDFITNEIGNIEGSEKAKTVALLYSELNTQPAKAVTIDMLNQLVTSSDLDMIRHVLAQIVANLPVPEAISGEQIQALYMAVEEAVKNI